MASLRANKPFRQVTRLMVHCTSVGIQGYSRDTPGYNGICRDTVRYNEIHGDIAKKSSRAEVVMLYSMAKYK